MTFDYLLWIESERMVEVMAGVFEGRTDGTKICAAADGIFTFAPNASSITR